MSPDFIEKRLYHPFATTKRKVGPGSLHLPRSCAGQWRLHRGRLKEGAGNNVPRSVTIVKIVVPSTNRLKAA